MNAPTPRKLDLAYCAAYASLVLSDPPRNPWTERHEPHGKLVVRFFLPLELCKSQNTAERHRPHWAHAKERKELLGVMSGQLHRFPGIGHELALGSGGTHFQFRRPLPGRPCVHAVRFSAGTTDACANFGKQAIDLLQPPRVRVGKNIPGLGIIADDSPKACDVRQWVEVGKRGEGFVMVSVYAGSPTP